MTKHKVEADWTALDVETLAPAQANAYANYKTAYRMMKDARELFEASMQAGEPEGQRMILGYNFGKLSAAIVPDDRKPTKAKASTQSLADFLKAQASAGNRS